MPEHSLFISSCTRRELARRRPRRAIARLPLLQSAVLLALALGAFLALHGAI